MKSIKIAFPLVHKKSSLPTFGAFLGIIAAIPIMMVMWVAMCSQFTKVEGTNETGLFNVYVCIRALFAIALVAGVVVYDLRRASVALVPAAGIGFLSAFIKLFIAISTYSEKKALAEAMSIHSSYTQNFIDIAEAGLLLLTALFMLVYLLGLLKTPFPVIFASVISVIFMLYAVIAYSTTYQASDFAVISRAYTIPLSLGVLLFCLSSKTKAQIEGKVKKEKYVPRRMKK